MLKCEQLVNSGCQSTNCLEERCVTSSRCTHGLAGIDQVMWRKKREFLTNRHDNSASDQIDQESTQVARIQLRQDECHRGHGLARLALSS